MAYSVGHFFNENKYCLTLNATPVIAALSGVGVGAYGIVNSNNYAIIAGSILFAVSTAATPFMTWFSSRIKKIEKDSQQQNQQLLNLINRLNQLHPSRARASGDGGGGVALNSIEEDASNLEMSNRNFSV